MSENATEVTYVQCGNIRQKSSFFFKRQMPILRYYHTQMQMLRIVFKCCPIDFSFVLQMFFFFNITASLEEISKSGALFYIIITLNRSLVTHLFGQQLFLLESWKCQEIVHLQFMSKMHLYHPVSVLAAVLLLVDFEVANGERIESTSGKTGRKTSLFFHHWSSGIVNFWPNVVGARGGHIYHNLCVHINKGYVE